MTRPLNVLFVEDTPADTELALRQLRKAGYEPSWKRVDTEAGYLDKLDEAPDIILSDYKMPHFSGSRALELLQARDMDVPFIIISGTIGEDIAVEIMRAGASDYLLKDRLGRLGPAIDRALASVQLRRTQKQAEKALSESEQEFRTLAGSVPQIVWVTLSDGWNIFFNDRWVEYTGMSKAESVGHAWYKPVHPEDQQRAWNLWQDAIAEVTEYSVEVRIRRFDGSYRWWLTRAIPLLDGAGSILKWFGTCTDIHELKLAEFEINRINRALKMLSECNEMLTRIGQEQELCSRICKIAVETGGYRMAWVGYAQMDTRKRVIPMAHAGEEDGYLSNFNMSWDENVELGRGPTGQAIRTGTATVCEDITQSPIFASWLPIAQEHGYRSIICLPLRDANHRIGVIALYSSQVNQPSDDEIKLLQKMADSLAFGILTLRGKLERKSLRAAVVSVAAGVSTATGTEFFEKLAVKLAEALGAKGAFVAELLGGAPLTARTIAAVVDGEVVANFGYRIQGTPCENLTTSPVCVIAKSVAEQFPLSSTLAALGAEAYVGLRLDSSVGNPLGIIYVIFQRPLEEVEFVKSTLQIFGARAGSELERLQTDIQLKEHAALIDNAQDAILVQDLKSRITYWNKSAERIFGWVSAEVIGRALTEVFHPDEPAFDEAWRTLFERGDWMGAISVEGKAGQNVLVQSRWTLMRDSEGRPRSVLVINTDMTERKKLEEQLFQAQRLDSIGTLAGGIAHDLNNALTPIMMAVDLLKMTDPEPDSRELLEIIHASANHGADLVRQILSFARGIEMKSQDVRVGDLIQDIEKIAKDTFLKQIQVKTTVSADLWTILGDPTQLRQVLMNLCMNALVAMPGGGMLLLSAENIVLDSQELVLGVEAPCGPYVLIQVEDDGIGMSPEIIQKVFDPFFTTKEVGKGTGLGLSTSLAIVRSHHGFIRVYSEPGKGTKFNIYIPAQVGVAPQEMAAPQAAPVSGRGELILMTDDEASVCLTAKRFLEEFGYRVAVAHSGAEAVEFFAARHEEVGAVITDMMMPSMDGRATIRELLKIDPKVRIIASSGLSGDFDDAQLSDRGVRGFLPKPYQSETLLKMLSEVLAE